MNWWSSYMPPGSWAQVAHKTHYHLVLRAITSYIIVAKICFTVKTRNLPRANFWLLSYRLCRCWWQCWCTIVDLFKKTYCLCPIACRLIASCPDIILYFSWNVRLKRKDDIEADESAAVFINVSHCTPTRSKHGRRVPCGAWHNNT